MYLFSALRSFIFFYSSMTAPVGTIPLPFRVFNEPQNAYEQLWNEETPHVYAVHYASPPGVRNGILQKRWRLVCAVPKAVDKGNETVLSVQREVVSCLQEPTILRPVKVVHCVDEACGIVPPLRATRLHISCKQRSTNSHWMHRCNQLLASLSPTDAAPHVGNRFSFLDNP